MKILRRRSTLEFKVWIRMFRFWISDVFPNLEDDLSRISATENFWHPASISLKRFEDPVSQRHFFERFDLRTNQFGFHQLINSGIAFRNGIHFWLKVEKSKTPSSVFWMKSLNQNFWWFDDLMRQNWRPSSPAGWIWPNMAGYGHIWLNINGILQKRRFNERGILALRTKARPIRRKLISFDSADGLLIGSA